eukprot:14773-Heterococcus_DN1.PRE.1
MHAVADEQLLLDFALCLHPCALAAAAAAAVCNSAHMQIERTKVIKGKMYTAATAAFCDVISSIH